IFKDVLPGSLSAAGGWALAGVDPGAPTKAWSGKLSSASIQATVDLSKLNHTTSPGGRGGGSISTYTYSVPGGNTVSWSLSGTTLTVRDTGQLQYSGTQNQTLTYNQHRETTVYPCFSNCTRSADSQLSTQLALNVAAVLSLTVAGTDRNQTIQV